MRKALICPTKYVQGENELVNLGYFVLTFGRSALLIAHPDDARRVEGQLKETAEKYGVRFIEGAFGGECSGSEIARLKALAGESACDCVVGLGGGKAIDAAKCVAEGEALIIVPTIAATDAPTSHSAVIYTEDGAFDAYAYFKQSPGVVLVDTTVIANAPTRFLVSGMGDALSTYFEARSTARASASVNAGLPCGYREGLAPAAKPTKAALALAELCYRTLLEDGLKAKQDCERNAVTAELENIIEANILLSGLGFESGGLAAAHAIHDGLTILEGTHGYFHGEKVAFGTLAHLVLENAPVAEIEEALGFCESVGLPMCLADIGVSGAGDDEIMAVAEKACAEDESIHSMPFPVTPESVAEAIAVADAMGSEYKARAAGRRADGESQQ
jgi:glycerol dehydrogenase